MVAHSSDVRAKAVILGAGGHARVVASILAALDGWDIVGILDENSASVGETIMGRKVIGTFANIGDLASSGVSAAFLASGDGQIRADLFAQCEAEGISCPPLVHPSAHIDPAADIGEAAVVCAMAFVGPLATLGRGALLNTRASVDHESSVAPFVTISPGVAIAGRCRIGELAFLGIGCVVSDKCTVGNNACIGAGAVVLDDVAAGEFVTGIPARPRKRSKPD